MSLFRPKTMRGRLAWFYAVALLLVLGAFSATIYIIEQAEEADEPAQVKALEPPEHPERRFLAALAAALPVALLVALAGGAWVARRGLAPLDDVVATATRIGTDNLDQRIAERPGAALEVAQLVGTLNKMLERLESSVAGMKRFTADASHELRTPLAALLGDLEITLRRPRTPDELRGTIENTLEELGRLSRLVDSLLTLARSDAGGLPVSPEPVDLMALARRAVEPYEAVLAARQVRLVWSQTSAVPALADPLWTSRAIANLVDNACKFTADGGDITLTVHADSAHARFEIQDSGPGVAAADRERIFERFFRGEAARAGAAGAGLGLPLAREIARAQGGDLRLEPGDRGARFVLLVRRG